MPQIQLGLYMMSRREALSAVPWALAAGYRGFDSAQAYGNEAEAGRAIRSFLGSPHGDGDDNDAGAALARGDVFYTSKLAANSRDYAAVRRSIKKSVDACGLGYIDLFLLHSPYGGPEARLTSWRAVEDAIQDGEVRSGGVSNYGVRHVSTLVSVLLSPPPPLVLFFSS
jgi:diketogulonate reductase-like aldo/keto reductase